MLPVDDAVVSGRTRRLAQGGSAWRLVEDELEARFAEAGTALSVRTVPGVSAGNWLVTPAQARRRELFQEMPVPCCALDAEGRILELNTAAVELLDGEADGQCYRGQHFTHVVRNLDASRFWALLDGCLRSQLPASGDFRLQTIVGRELRLRFIARPHQGMCLVSLSDASEQQRAEERLQFLGTLGESLVAEPSLKDALSAAAGMSAPYLADLCVVALKRGGVAQLALAHADYEQEQRLLAQFTADQIPPALRNNLEENAARIACDTGLARWLGLPHRGGEYAAYVVPLRTRGGDGWLFACEATGPSRRRLDLPFLTDVARQVSLALDNVLLHEQVLRDVQLREDFLSVFSQDLINAVTGVRLSAEALREVETARTQVKAVEDAAESALEHVRRLVELVHLTQAQTRMQPEPVRVDALLDQVEQMVFGGATARGVRVLRTRAPEVWFKADPRLHQAVLFLVENALRHSPVGGAMQLFAHVSGGAVEISISDEGPGISANELPVLFTRSQRGGQGKAGAGLGLSTAKTLIEAHGGTLRVESQLGVGTTFTMRLAAEPPPRGQR